MKTIIIGDIHNHTEGILEYLSTQKYDEVVWLGDFFDNFFDTPEIAGETARFVKKLLEDPRNKLCFGNHDMPYAFPFNKFLACPGFTNEKCSAVRQILDQNDFNQFKLFYFTNDFYLSHAGINAHLFSDPLKGVTPSGITEKCNEALLMAAGGQKTLYLEAGRDRGGREKHGGITWMDWHSLKPIDGINQVVGHTPSYDFREKITPKSENYRIDCMGQFFASITRGHFHLIDRN